MAAPMVAAAARARPPPQPRPAGGRDRPPDQGDRAPPAGQRLDARPGLGDPRRGRRADAARATHRPPRAVSKVKPLPARTRQHADHAALARRRQPRPAGVARVGHRALRAVARDRRRGRCKLAEHDDAHVARGARCAAAGATASSPSRSTTRATASRAPAAGRRARSARAALAACAGRGRSGAVAPPSARRRAARERDELGRATPRCPRRCASMSGSAS